VANSAGAARESNRDATTPTIALLLQVGRPAQSERSYLVPAQGHALSEEEFALIGKVTVSGAYVEELVYSIAESLAVDAPRKTSVSVAAEKIKDQLKEAGVPPRASATVEQVPAWLAEAKAALFERNDVVHSISIAQYNGDEWVSTQQPTDRKTPTKPRDTDRWEAVRQRLRQVAESGLELGRGLMAQLAPGIHYTVYGKDAGRGSHSLPPGHGMAVPPDRRAGEGLACRLRRSVLPPRRRAGRRSCAERGAAKCP